MHVLVAVLHPANAANDDVTWKWKVVVHDVEHDVSKTVVFGQRHASDLTQHADVVRARNYLRRHGATWLPQKEALARATRESAMHMLDRVDTSDREDWWDPYTAGFWSRWLLWSRDTLESAANVIRRMGIDVTLPGQHRSGGGGRAVPLDADLYQKVKDVVRKRFKRWPSAYGSAALAKEYVRRGGRYAGAPTRQKVQTGVSRWMREEWIQVEPYLRDGVIVSCGASDRDVKACRPRFRISHQTPLTIDELCFMHGKPRLLALCRKKHRDMDGYIEWATASFRPSRKPDQSSAPGRARTSSPIAK